MRLRTLSEFAGDMRCRSRCLRQGSRIQLLAEEMKWGSSRPLGLQSCPTSCAPVNQNAEAVERVVTEVAWNRQFVCPLLLSLTWSRRHGGYGRQVIFSKGVVERRKLFFDELLVVRDSCRQFRFYFLKQV